ncbi:MAG: carbonic anhydrase family protein [Bacteroidetes bacterium]|nr:carbonic anhydrase family protein [Bacteroidota bacterium]
MKRKLIIPLIVLAFCSGCCTNSENNKKDSGITAKTAPREHVLTAGDQAKLTPDQVISELKEGNKHFTGNILTLNNFPEQIKKSVDAQFPEAVILSCMDSRVPPEYIFDKSIGDLFVIRVAGNIINQDILGSMEYACKESGAKLIIVMGHQHCGAVKAAIEDIKLGNITGLLQKIRPAIEKSASFQGEKSYKNEEYLSLVCLNNVFAAINEIKARSPILKEMSDKGEIRIVGALYDLNTGIVKFLE